MTASENTLGLKPREGAGKNPRVDQCFICRAWQLEKNLLLIDIPDQGAAWVEKKCCQSCLDKLQPSAKSITMIDLPSPDTCAVSERKGRDHHE